MSRVTATKKSKKRADLKKGEEDLEILVALDYQVQQFSEYHFRINNRLDIWPSSKKWCLPGQKSGTYTDLQALVRQKLGPKIL